MTQTPTCPRCRKPLNHVPGEDDHWATRDDYPVCSDLVRPDAQGGPEWHVEVVLRELEALRSAIAKHEVTAAARAWEFGKPPPEEYGSDADRELWAASR